MRIPPSSASKLPQEPSGKPFRVGRLLTLALAFAASVFAFTGPALAQIGTLGPWLDACTGPRKTALVTTQNVPTVGTTLSVSHTAGGLASKQVVIIVNGNSYGPGEYGPLSSYLVQQGYITAVAWRPGAGNAGDAAYVLDVVGEVLGAVGIAAADPDLTIGLVGHSQGGRLTVEAAALNQGAVDPLPIKAVVGLSPAGEDTTVLSGFGMPAYLSLYGTQDEDLWGFGGNIHEAFRGYDQVGTEGSTTCNSPPCLATPQVDKTMVYIYGADHSGLIGVDIHPTGAVAGLPQSIEYISADDQLCLSRAYSTAFFHWQLGGDSYYKGFIRDDWRPLPITVMTTSDIDGFGNPANEPIRMFSQISPKARKVIQNFQGGHGNPTHSPDMMVSAAAPLVFGHAPYFVRHNTGAAFLGWPTGAGLRFARWDVPNSARVGSTYTHLSIRIGQAAGVSPNEPHANTPNADLRVYVGISDAFGETDLLPMDLPSPDPYLDDLSKARTAMSTFRFPVDELNPELDLDEIEGLWIIVTGNSHGTVLVDSMEWHRDP